MKKILLLYSGGKAPSNPKEAEASMKTWMAWFGSLGKTVLEAGNPFGDAMTVSKKGSEGGSGGNPSNGWSVIEAASVAAAAKLVKECPIIAEGGKVHLFELQAM